MIFFWCMIILEFTECFNFSISQTATAVRLSKHLVINNCIILTAQVEKISSKIFRGIKYLSESNMQGRVIPVRDINELLAKTNYHRTLVIMEEDIVPQLPTIFSAKNEKYLLKFNWAVFDASEESLDNIYIPYNTEFFVVKGVNGTHFEIEEKYKIKEKDVVRTILYGTGDAHGIQVDNPDFYGRRFDLNGTLMIVATARYNGECYDLTICAYEQMVYEFGLMMQFRPAYLDWETYFKLKKNYTDLTPDVKLLLYIFHSVVKSSDVVGPIWKTPAYLHISFNHLYEHGHSSPYLRPFTKYLWMAVLAFVVVSGIVLIIIGKAIPSICVIKGPTTTIDLFFTPLESFSNQTGSHISNTNSLRLATLITRVAPFFIIPMYLAAVSSFVTVRILKLPFTNLEELITDGTFKVGFPNNTFLSLFFARTNDLVSKMVYENFTVDLDEMPKVWKEAVHKMCEHPKFAFIDFSDHISEKPECKILKIHEPVLIAWDAFELRKNSPYKKIFNRNLKTYFSAGILKKVEKLIYPKIRLFEMDDDADPVELNSSLLHLYLGLATCYIFSLLTLSLEYIYWKNKAYKRLPVRYVYSLGKNATGLLPINEEIELDEPS